MPCLYVCATRSNCQCVLVVGSTGRSGLTNHAQEQIFSSCMLQTNCHGWGHGCCGKVTGRLARGKHPSFRTPNRGTCGAATVTRSYTRTDRGYARIINTEDVADGAGRVLAGVLAGCWQASGRGRQMATDSRTRRHSCPGWLSGGNRARRPSQSS